MCYSALIQQDLKKLSATFKARIDETAFLDLFTERADASEKILAGQKGVRKVVVAKALDFNFLQALATTESSREIRRQIVRWQKLETARLSDELRIQSERFRSAEAALVKKRTKKSEDDLRIGMSKATKAKRDLENLGRPSRGEDDSWIWPKYHFPGVVTQNAERVIRPFRYLLRPQGQASSFDEKYNGAYNAQQERLGEVFFWRELLGRHHGVMQVIRFRERQDEVLPPGKHLRVVNEVGTRKEFEFDPGYPITVPFLWDHWRDPKGLEKDLVSAAAITCEPSLEIKASGIRRVLTPLAERHLDPWENPSRADISQYAKILADYRWDHLQYKEIA